MVDTNPNPGQRQGQTPRQANQRPDGQREDQKGRQDQKGRGNRQEEQEE